MIRISPTAPAFARFAIVVFPLIAAAAPPAGATTAADLCPAAADPCVIGGNRSIDPGSVLDFGGRAVQLTGTANLFTSGGDVTLRAGALTALPGSLIRSAGTTRADPAGDVTIEVASANYSGDLDVRGSPAGDVTIEATGAFSFGGTLRGRSEAADESAALVEISADTLVLGGVIELLGGREEIGGELAVSGTSVSVTGRIDVSGGDGGSVELLATTSLLVDGSAEIRADSTVAAGDGGEITLDCDSQTSVAGELSTDGRSGGDEGGGDGGSVTIGGDQGIEITSAAEVQTLGGSPDGLGGDVDILSFFGPVEVAGSVDASSDDRDGLGGSVDVAADSVLTITGVIEAVGGLGGGGDADLDSDGDLTIASGAVVDVSATRPARGGTLIVSAAATFRNAGTLLANSAQANEGNGGSVSIGACDLLLETGSRIESVGPGGINSLVTNGTMSVRGQLSAGPSNGFNRLEYPPGAPTPVINPGSQIFPGAMISVDQGLSPCRAFPQTPTPTDTAPPSASPTPTETVSSPTPGGACPGDCDGDGTVTIAELIRAVNIALGSLPLSACPAADVGGDGQVSISDLISAVNASLDGCP